VESWLEEQIAMGKPVKVLIAEMAKKTANLVKDSCSQLLKQK